MGIGAGVCGFNAYQVEDRVVKRLLVKTEPLSVFNAAGFLFSM
jgi:hypothetical protein